MTQEIQIECEDGHIISTEISDEELDWELTDAEECNMGVKRTYEAVSEIVCPDCDATITLTFRGWEYPIGVVNDTDLEIEGGELVGDFDVYDFFHQLITQH